MYLPVAHVAPLRPFTHVQVYVLTPSTQVPPFLHGFVVHSSVSTRIAHTYYSQYTDYNYIGYVHTLVIMYVLSPPKQLRLLVELCPRFNKIAIKMYKFQTACGQGSLLVY